MGTLDSLDGFGSFLTPQQELVKHDSALQGKFTHREPVIAEVRQPMSQCRPLPITRAVCAAPITEHQGVGDCNLALHGGVKCSEFEVGIRLFEPTVVLAKFSGSYLFGSRLSEHLVNTLNKWGSPREMFEFKSGCYQSDCPIGQATGIKRAWCSGFP
ncbi:hypothetical protein C8R44DRAFT_738769 [Mycena epipterygia]|nr:hypothetical protein C8R44DRAFT_738769 [Mycena epipterygia]